MEGEMETTEQLRLQFQALQKLQMQRLRKTQQKQKQNMSETARCINAKGDMNLSMSNTDMEEKFSSRTLQQEIQELQVQVRELKDENGRLRKLLKEKEFELQYLKRRRDEDMLTLAGMAEDCSKSVEPSKRNQELAVEIEREKTKTKEMRNRVEEQEVRDLKMQLNVARGRRGDFGMEEDYMSEGGLYTNYEDKNLSYIRSIEKERKEALEKLKGDNKLLTNENEDMKKKLKASKARNDTLTTELKYMKKHMIELLEKDKHDNELMDALLKKKAKLEDMLSQLRQEETWHQRDYKQHQAEEKRLDYTIKQLQQALSERERVVEQLTFEVQQQQAEVKRLDCMVSERDSKIQELAGVIEELKYKKSAEDSCCSACVAKLTTLHAQCNEYMAVYKMASVERDKLHELDLLQQKQIENLKQRCEEMEERLHKERLNSMLLEKELGKSRLELESARASTAAGQVRGRVVGVSWKPVCQRSSKTTAKGPAW